MLALTGNLQEEREKQELEAAIVTEAAGGIHEVYFPYVWSNLRLLLPLILGGVSGTILLFLCWEPCAGRGIPGKHCDVAFDVRTL